MALLDRINPVPLTWGTALRALLTAIAAVLFAVGWSASMVVRGIRGSLIGAGYAVGWSVAAIRVGYAAGRSGTA